MGLYSIDRSMFDKRLKELSDQVKRIADLMETKVKKK